MPLCAKVTAANFHIHHKDRKPVGVAILLYIMYADPAPTTLIKTLETMDVLKQNVIIFANCMTLTKSSLSTVIIAINEKT